MPNKVQTIYVCSACDAQFPKWSGRCLECGGWGTLQMQTVDQKTNDKMADINPAQIIDLQKIKNRTEDKRLATNIKELDRVLGGATPNGEAGIMPGSVILLGGEPGIGKSTLVAQIANAISKNGQIIYTSGEESANQIKPDLID